MMRELFHAIWPDKSAFQLDCLALAIALFGLALWFVCLFGWSD
jgi:hypothetical protein